VAEGEALPAGVAIVDALSRQIAELQAEFQHFADLHPWACLAIPPLQTGFGPPHIGEKVGHPWPQLGHPVAQAPEDRGRRCVVEHLHVLTDQAHKALLSMLAGQHGIPADVVQDIRDFDQRCPGNGWIRWLWFSTIPQQPHRYENYPQVAATALRVLRAHCNAPGDSDRDFSIDGPNAFALYKTLAAQKGKPITRQKLRAIDSRFRGDKTIPRLRGRLPRALRDTVVSTNAGYWLQLPAKKQIRA